MRNPAVAGLFYSGRAEDLAEEVDSALSSASQETLPIVGAVVPHAGYMYSGGVAAEVYARLPRRETYVLIGPNHSDPRNVLAAASSDSWKTPLGAVDADKELAAALAGSIIDCDEEAHRGEHSLEVQLPFLQRRFSGFKILPISMGGQDYETALEVGEAVAGAIIDLGRDCTILASSDFSHDLLYDDARRLDIKLVEAILKMDIADIYSLAEFHSQNYGYKATPCGLGPIAATIAISKKLGAKMAKLLRYSTSKDVDPNGSRVVGYSAIAFT